VQTEVKLGAKRSAAQDKWLRNNRFLPPYLLVV